MALTQQRPIDYTLYDQETDPTPIDQTVLILDHPSWTEPKKILWPISTSSTDVLLGGNLISSSGWTSTGWTGNSSIGWTHTVGNTTVLSNVLAAIIDSNYQIQLTVSGRTAGSFTVAFGGDTSIALNSSAYYTILATTNGNLQITPTTDFDGTIIIAIKEVVWQITEAEILDILGLTGETIASQEWVAAGYVEIVSGKSLISDTEITRLLGVKQNVYTVLLSSASNVTDRITGATIPSGWSLAVDSVVNLKVTNNLTGRKCVDVKVWEVDGSTERLAKPFSDAYSGVSQTGLDVLIEGLDTIVLPLRVEFIFA